MHKTLKFLSLCSLIVLSSCSKYYITCDKQVRNRDYLASSYTKSPDPTPDDQIYGEQLVVAWHVPSSFVDKANCELELTYWDFSQEKINFTLHERLGQYTLENLGKTFEKNKGIIAYKATLKDPKGDIYQTWQHQLFTKIIHVSDEEIEVKEDPVTSDDDPWDWESSL